MNKKYTFTVIFEKDPYVSGYNVIVPRLPGCFTQGETLEEAKKNAFDAIFCHLSGLLKDKQKFPQNKEEFISHLEISFSAISKNSKGKFLSNL